MCFEDTIAFALVAVVVAGNVGDSARGSGQRTERTSASAPLELRLQAALPDGPRSRNEGAS